MTLSVYTEAKAKRVLGKSDYEEVQAGTGAAIAQLVEPLAVNEVVPGSSPGGGVSHFAFSFYHLYSILVRLLSRSKFSFRHQSESESESESDRDLDWD